MQRTAIKTFKFLLLLQLMLMSISCEDKTRNMIDGKLEPPEPGYFENDKTMGGIDSNNDGVRDDIERWINREFPGEENYNKRMGWKYYAREIRNIQLNVGDKELLTKHSYLWADANVCVFYIYTAHEKGKHRMKIKMGDDVLEKMNNTKQRLGAWQIADKNFAGRAHALPMYSVRHKSCKFTLKN